MHRFARLYADLDASTSTRAKLDALARYWASLAERGAYADGAWAVYLLGGGKVKQAVPTKVLREAAREQAGLPDWLFDSCYQTVGDLAETIALVVGDGQGQASADASSDASSDTSLAHWITARVQTLRAQPQQAQIAALRQAWSELDAPQRFLFNKLITGGFRVGVSRLLVAKSLSQAFELSPETLALRLMGYLSQQHQPDADSFAALIANDDAQAPYQASDLNPYPFQLAHPWQGDAAAMAATLGAAGDWLVEWKWDGIRAQCVVRGGDVALWSRGEELIADRFPEILEAARHLPEGCVLDGEVLGWDFAAHRPLPFADLQHRIGRKQVSAKVMQACPVVFVAYDLLQRQGQDLRAATMVQRRMQLLEVVGALSATELGRKAQAACLRVSDAVQLASEVARLVSQVKGFDKLSPNGAEVAPSALQDQRASPTPLPPETDGWLALDALRQQARQRGAEGLMLKRLDAPYSIGRTRKSPRGDWWKWKLDPMTVDAVLIYAQRGHGRRASLYTDYTFAVWDQDGPQAGRLLPFAKAYSGLTDAEFAEVDALIQRTTIEKFGPVRSVTPSLVIEIGFEGIQRSTRHRSGFAVRFPRMLRLRWDKPVEQADTVQVLQDLLSQQTGGA